MLSELFPGRVDAMLKMDRVSLSFNLYPFIQQIFFEYQGPSIFLGARCTYQEQNKVLSS